MASVYSPVFSHRTGWVLGKIVDHVAKPLTRDEVDQLSDELNALDETRRAERVTLERTEREFQRYVDAVEQLLTPKQRVRLNEVLEAEEGT